MRITFATFVLLTTVLLLVIPLDAEGSDAARRRRRHRQLDQDRPTPAKQQPKADSEQPLVAKPAMEAGIGTDRGGKSGRSSPGGGAAGFEPAAAAEIDSGSVSEGEGSQFFLILALVIATVFIFSPVLIWALRRSHPEVRSHLPAETGSQA